MIPIYCKVDSPQILTLLRLYLVEILHAKVNIIGKEPLLLDVVELNHFKLTLTFLEYLEALCFELIKLDLQSA